MVELSLQLSALLGNAGANVSPVLKMQVTSTLEATGRWILTVKTVSG
jgi:hypothetical protein